jgi:hypothetical protein
VRVEFFMVLPVSKRMPPQLRKALIAAGLLDPGAPRARST